MCRWHAWPAGDPQRPEADRQLAAIATNEVLLLAIQLQQSQESLKPNRVLLQWSALLCEQGGVPRAWIVSEDVFRATVAHHVELPHEIVPGHEPSDGAAARVAACYQFPVLVTHGKVLCGFPVRFIDIDFIDIGSDPRMSTASAVRLLRMT